VKEFPIQGPFVEQAMQALAQVPLFAGLGKQQLTRVVSAAGLLRYEAGEPIVRQGEPANDFFVIMNGSAAVLLAQDDSPQPVEVAELGRLDGIGEMGLLLGERRTATVLAKEPVFALRFAAAAFHAMFEQVPGFGVGICRALADRLEKTSSKLPQAKHLTPPPPDVFALLPLEFIQRYRVVPVKVQGNTLTLGFVDEPTSQAVSGIQQLLPSMEFRPLQIDGDYFDLALSSHTAVEGWSQPEDRSVTSAPGVSAGEEPRRSSPRLDAILRRMVAAGASDLHLSAGHRARWRVDGDIRTLQDTSPLSASEVFELFEPILREESREQFLDSNDLDYAYAIPGLARFRVNVFRDNRGVGAVLRVIPDKILTVQQLGLPETVLKLSQVPKGLVVVTGPTGSGKSTTLAAMLDHINDTRPEHVITMEDPIEFVHQSRQALFNQREVGPHTNSFSSALKAALRQDPDIVLVGEMRDRETIELAMETANTGHLVFGTLHTATAISTVERIVNVFPPEMLDQVRTSLADALKGVVAQCLCKKVGGGRMAAIEILVVNFAVQNLIRAAKTHQIASIMATGARQGNRLLNVELARLVSERKVAYEEALSKAVDKPDLAKRCNQPFDTNQ